MIRREPTYLSTDVWRALHTISKAKVPRESYEVPTVDKVADDMLRQIITEKYPQLFEHQKQVAKLEAELIKTLQ